MYDLAVNHWRIVLIIVGACQKEPDSEQAQRISGIGKTLIKVGIGIINRKKN